MFHSGRALARWRPPALSGLAGPAAWQRWTYELRLTDAAGHSREVENVTDTEVTVEQLAPDTQYTLQVSHVSHRLHRSVIGQSQVTLYVSHRSHCRSVTGHTEHCRSVTGHTAGKSQVRQITIQVSHRSVTGQLLVTQVTLHVSHRYQVKQEIL